ncbi:MAG: hypothetical protein Q7J86_15890 [Bacteroidota bacterium]|nr:hypothetical protein [Bacteroidota bacterium]
MENPMKPQTQTILKRFVLSIFWLIFPPLFLILSIVWKSPKLVMRIVLTAIAPLTIVAIVIGIFSLNQLHYYYIERGSRTEIEAKTGMEFPDYETVEKRHFSYGPSFNGDFTMERTVKFDTVNIHDFYEQIDLKIIETGKNTLNSFSIYWSMQENGNYSFTHFDPQDEDDQTLELEIDKKNSQVRITYGRM